MDILIILALLLLNGLLAMSEIAVVSAQNPRLKQRADAGDRGAAAALQLTKNPTRFLSTVQVGITAVGILLGALGDKSLTTDLAGLLAVTPIPAPIIPGLSLGIVVLLITFASVVLGELVPKRLAMSSPEAIASWVAPPMLLLSAVARPIVAVLSGTTELLLRLLGVSDVELDPVTSHEINLLIEEGAKSGEFTPEEQRLISRVLHMGDQRIGAAMIHRTEMRWLEASMPLDQARKVARESRQTSFALCRKNVDRIVGVVSLRDLLPTEGPPVTDLRAIASPPLFVPESAPVLRVLERLRLASAPIAFVVDEYGAVQGQVTTRDILDQLVGKVFRVDAKAV